YILMKKYEYKFINFSKSSGFTGVISSLNSEDLQSKFNELGKDGWQYLRAESIIEYQGGTKQILFVFQRELQA
ncbi:MAG: DUF4177 domain-containing protein, partial [bacterium]